MHFDLYLWAVTSTFLVHFDLYLRAVTSTFLVHFYATAQHDLGIVDATARLDDGIAYDAGSVEDDVQKFSDCPYSHL